MNTSIEELQKKIASIKVENSSLSFKAEQNKQQILDLQQEIKKIENESSIDWYKLNSLKKYYKRVSHTYCCTIEYYINIDDKIPNKYNRSIKKIIDNEEWLDVESFEIFLGKYEEAETITYNMPSKVSTNQFKHLKEDGNHGMWAPITEEEFEEAKKRMIEFIKNKKG